MVLHPSRTARLLRFAAPLARNRGHGRFVRAGRLVCRRRRPVVDDVRSPTDPAFVYPNVASIVSANDAGAHGMREYKVRSNPLPVVLLAHPPSPPSPVRVVELIAV